MARRRKGEVELLSSCFAVAADIVVANSNTDFDVA